MDTLTLDTLDTLVDIATTVLNTVGASALLAALLPRSPRFAWLFKLLDVLAANWGRARNASASPAAEVEAVVRRQMKNAVKNPRPPGPTNGP